MRSVSAVLLAALSAVAVKATNTTGDPTNIANWPACAQKCIPLGLTAPASCGSLSNIACVCQNPTFSISIANCEQTTCSTEELQQIQALSTPLCAPVGGLASSVVSAVSSYFATVSATASGVPTYPATVTAATAVSAIQATATPAPNLGDPANILTYPLCAQTCGNETILSAGCDLSNIECLCGASYRSITAACQQVICSPEDKQTTSALAEQLCGPVYRNIPSLGSAVSSAIASATSVAASVATRDPTKIASYPICAQKCQTATLPASGCGSLSNRTCVCKGNTLNPSLGSCETANCSTSDLRITADLAYALCNPVGGIGNTTNATYPTAGSTPTPSAYTGDASTVMERSLGLGVVGLMAVLGWLALL